MCKLVSHPITSNDLSQREVIMPWIFRLFSLGFLLYNFPYDLNFDLLNSGNTLIACNEHRLKTHWYFILNLINCKLTQTAELSNYSGQRVVGYTFQLVANSIGHGTVAQVPRLNVPLHQRHDPFSHLPSCLESEDRADSSLLTATCGLEQSTY